jgi:hypothetical protein
VDDAVTLEYGGDFHATTDLPQGGPLLAELYPKATLWGSGRAALLALLETRRWKRLWIPTYVCDEVVSAAAGAVEVVRYLDHPLLLPAGLPADVVSGDAVLRVNYFGLRGAEEIGRCPGEVIEDHTHDPTGPWARGSKAPFAMASLRKTFPSADGGVVWSPAGERVPEEREATVAHLAAADAKLRAMEMKASYLRGRPVEKKAYRTLFAAGEARIGSLSGIHPETRALLARVSPVALAGKRRDAWEVLSRATPWTVAARGDPFALVLDLGSAAVRDGVLRALVAEGIWPSVLWPLSWWRSERATRLVSKRLLTVSCDFRSPPGIVREVASVLGSLSRA